MLAIHITNMSEEISMRGVTKFDGQNFQIWKFQVNSILTAYGILDIVNGTRARPADTSEALLKTWIKENAKAMFILSTSMEPKQMESLITCTTAREMWIKLSSIHEQKSATNALILTQRFHEYKMNSTDSVVQHVAKVQNMAQQLKDVGEAVSDVAIMAKIIAGLPHKFNALKTAWDSVSIEQQTVDNLTERSIKEELRLSTDDETPGAFAAMSLGRNRKSAKDFKKPFNKFQNKDPEARRNTTDQECYFCHKKGHFAKDCWKKKAEKETKRPQSDGNNSAFSATLSRSKSDQGGQSVRKSVPSSDTQEESSRALGCKLLDRDVNDVWLTDSGASRHVTIPARLAS